MKKRFAIKLLIFLIPVVVAFVAVEVQLGKVQNSYNKKRRYLEKNKENLEVLVLGSSHSLHGIDPGQFSHKGFNLANSSQSIFYDKELTKLNIDKLPKLKLVIIPVSYFSMYSELSDYEESYRDYYYYHFWGIAYKDVSPWESKKYSRLFLYSPEEAVTFVQDKFNTDLVSNLHESGFIPKDTLDCAKNISDSLGRERVIFHNKISSPKRFPEVKAELDELVQTLTSKGIKVAIITTPVYNTYSQYCDAGKLTEMRGAINSICNTYDCRFYDYFNDPRFSKTDFWDNDHLNFIGAGRFSTILDEEIIRPAIDSVPVTNP